MLCQFQVYQRDSHIVKYIVLQLKCYSMPKVQQLHMYTFCSLVCSLVVVPALIPSLSVSDDVPVSFLACTQISSRHHTLVICVSVKFRFIMANQYRPEIVSALSTLTHRPTTQSMICSLRISRVRTSADNSRNICHRRPQNNRSLSR